MFLTPSSFDQVTPCPTPGMKIRSGGAGRGLARGRGMGPIGVPYRPALGQAPGEAFKTAGKVLKYTAFAGGLLVIGFGLWLYSKGRA